MTHAWPNTSESSQHRWLDRQGELLASLKVQPFLLVVRPDQADLNHGDPETGSPLLAQLATLEASGLRHLEVAWSSHPGWSRLVEAIRSSFPSLALGAASVTERPALDDLERLALPYAMSPCSAGRPAFQFAG